MNNPTAPEKAPRDVRNSTEIVCCEYCHGDLIVRPYQQWKDTPVYKAMTECRVCRKTGNIIYDATKTIIKDRKMAARMALEPEASDWQPFAPGINELRQGKKFEAPLDVSSPNPHVSAQEHRGKASPGRPSKATKAGDKE